MSVPGKGGEDLLLVSSDSCVLLDGRELALRWTFSAPQVLRYRLFPRTLCSCCKPRPTSPSPWEPRGGGQEDQCASVSSPLPAPWSFPACLLPVLGLPRQGEEGGLPAPRCLLTETPRAFFPRKPILGHYKPDTLAVVIENGTGIDRQVGCTSLCVPT